MKMGAKPHENRSKLGANMLKLLRRVELWLFGNPPDPTWPHQTPIPKFTGYDRAAARRGFVNSRRGFQAKSTRERK